MAYLATKKCLATMECLATVECLATMECQTTMECLATIECLATMECLASVRCLPTMASQPTMGNLPTMDDEPNSSGDYGRHVECTWVAHAFKNYENLVVETNGNPMALKEVMDSYGGPTIINLRFIRDFSKNVEDSWTVN